MAIVIKICYSLTIRTWFKRKGLPTRHMQRQLAKFEVHQFLRVGRLEVQREELVDAKRQALLGEQVKAEDRFQAQEEVAPEGQVLEQNYVHLQLEAPLEQVHLREEQLHALLQLEVPLEQVHLREEQLHALLQLEVPLEQVHLREEQLHALLQLEVPLEGVHLRQEQHPRVQPKSYTLF
jgi:hypothetical protein